MSKIFVRTHGGLGNQLFQIFFALCEMQARNSSSITIIHDNRYAHRFSLCPKFSETKSAIEIENLTNYGYRKIIYYRLVKLIEKFKIGTPSVNINGFIFIDGYFQDKYFYKNFSPQIVSYALNTLRKIFDTTHEFQTNKSLHHIRLGDFFNSEKDKINHIMKALSNIEDSAHLITNEEHYFSQHESINKLFNQKKLNLIKTSNLKDFEILQLMMSYQSVHSNNSTLAFWATVLARTQLVVTNRKLLEMNEFITNHAN